jgi:hypothetical protein
MGWAYSCCEGDNLGEKSSCCYINKMTTWKNENKMEEGIEINVSWEEVVRNESGSCNVT